MRIGYLGNSKNPGKMSQCLNAFASLYGFEFFHFTPKRVNIKNKTIKGIFWSKDNPREYIEKEVPYPDIVDNANGITLSGEERMEIYQRSLCLYVHIRNKTKVYEILRKEGQDKYLVEWYKYGDIDIDEILKIHDKVILKPNSSLSGNGVHKLHRDGDSYLLHHGLSEERLNREQFNEYSKKLSRYVVQPYIKSVTDSGNPFDIRVDLRRGKNGEWVVVRIYSRIGNKGGIVSNLAQGGFIVNKLELFLQPEFGDDWRKILDEIDFMCEHIPNAVQAGYRRLIPSLGLDIGVNRANNNELKLFEINGSPLTNTREVEIARERIEYYSYLYKNMDELLAIQKESVK